MKNEITHVFAGKIENFHAVGTIKFEVVEGLRGESHSCILAHNAKGERAVIDTQFITSITPIL